MRGKGNRTALVMQGVSVSIVDRTSNSTTISVGAVSVPVPDIKAPLEGRVERTVRCCPQCRRCMNCAGGEVVSCCEKLRKLEGHGAVGGAMERARVYQGRLLFACESAVHLHLPDATVDFSMVATVGQVWINGQLMPNYQKYLGGQSLSAG